MLKLAGHRGYKDKEIENTKAAFLKAIEENLDYIEFDVRKTRDNVPIIFHDKDFSRMCKNTKAYVSDYDLNQIKSIRYPDNQEILTLNELFSFINGEIDFILDLKDEGIENSIIELIRRYRLEKRIIIQTRIQKSLKKMYKIAPDLNYALYLGYVGKLRKFSSSFILQKLFALLFYYLRIKKHPIRYFSSDGEFLYNELISLLKRKNIKVILGATKLKNYIKYLKYWDIDIIISNHAENTKNLIKKYEILN